MYNVLFSVFAFLEIFYICKKVFSYIIRSSCCMQVYFTIIRVHRAWCDIFQAYSLYLFPVVYKILKTRKSIEGEYLVSSAFENLRCFFYIAFICRLIYFVYWMLHIVGGLPIAIGLAGGGVCGVAHGVGIWGKSILGAVSLFISTPSKVLRISI